MKKQTSGSVIVGIIIGVVLGLAAALAVAVYVTKVPVPFLNKGQSRTRRTGRGRDAQEPRLGPQRAAVRQEPGQGRCRRRPPGVIAARAARSATIPAPGRRSAAAGTRPRPAAKPSGRSRWATWRRRAPAPSGGRPVLLFRAGRRLPHRRGRRSPARQAVADGHRGQGHRARAIRAARCFACGSGPFDKKDDADRQKEKLEAGGVETALVRVQR